VHEELRDTEDRLRILVADDNDELRDRIVEMLDPAFEVVVRPGLGRHR